MNLELLKKWVNRIMGLEEDLVTKVLKIRG